MDGFPYDAVWGAGNPRASSKPSANELFAELMFDMYNSLIEAGFNPEQAFQLTKAALPSGN